MDVAYSCTITIKYQKLLFCLVYGAVNMFVYAACSFSDS